MPAQTNIPSASLGKRYVFKLLANIATIPLFFLQESVLPRALGPATYGSYNFILAIFTQLLAFFDCGASSCLRTSLSKRPFEFGMLAFYARIICYISALLTLSAAAMYIPALGNWLLPGVPVWLIFPGMAIALLLWCGGNIRGICDSLGITTRSEVIRTVINLAAALSMLTLFLLGWLTLPTFLAQQIFTYGLLALALLVLLRHWWNRRSVIAGQKPISAVDWRLAPAQRQEYIKEYRNFCTPLVVIAGIYLMALFGERWMLQFFAGSQEQGYFSLSQRIGMACFLFVSAMMPLLHRELSVAHGQKDFARMGQLFERFAPLIYAVAAWFSCFTLVEAQAVTRLFGGDEFAAALIPVQIMALYPIHQGYGQLTTLVFYSSGDTRTFRNVSVTCTLFGMVCAWFFISPARFGGLELAATGLAIKTVALQIITVNILIYLCSKRISFSFRHNLLHQVYCPLACAGMALATKYLTMQGIASGVSLVRFFFSGTLYVFLSLIIAFTLPVLFGLQRKDRDAALARFVGWLRRLIRIIRKPSSYAGA